MREKIAQFFGGIIIYSVFGVLMVLVSGKGLAGQWHFILFWTIGMSLVHVFVMEPFRKRMAKKKAEADKSKINK
ncbi:hypothetical protein R1T16_10645 [Flavobacterium sp. DG1-102-2]|uniref:hypothetical protein n=1 Tax=Flavobacterium sp. DG1-102-2 TaxID=3081663 RepID=UPI0029492DEF|nr:hypothetical protein [Flavobacterium sp. DG1-102-2]MDV6168885.1 hypothetical protein [Flavobacterium sp. DG1-102-2]